MSWRLQVNACEVLTILYDFEPYNKWDRYRFTYKAPASFGIDTVFRSSITTTRKDGEDQTTPKTIADSPVQVGLTDLCFISSGNCVEELIACATPRGALCIMVVETRALVPEWLFPIYLFVSALLIPVICYTIVLFRLIPRDVRFVRQYRRNHLPVLLVA